MKMKPYISMLRGINVSGQNRIAMAELSKLYESLDLANVKTYVQSGNVVFESAQTDAANLAKSIELQINQHFGYSVPVFIREIQNFKSIIASNPFLNSRSEDPAKLHVTFLYEAAPVIKLGDLASPTQDGDEFVFAEQAIFLFCPNGYGRTKFSNSFFERKLKVAATTRNWKTVNALCDLAMEIVQC